MEISKCSFTYTTITNITVNSCVFEAVSLELHEKQENKQRNTMYTFFEKSFAVILVVQPFARVYCTVLPPHGAEPAFNSGAGFRIREVAIVNAVLHFTLASKLYDRKSNHVSS